MPYTLCAIVVYVCHSAINTQVKEPVCIWIKIIYINVNWFNAENSWEKKTCIVFLTLYSNMEYHLTLQYVY
jgi:hypothetical protein